MPNMATRWEVKNGDRELIFPLGRGVRWSDGHRKTGESAYWNRLAESISWDAQTIKCGILFHRQY